MTNHFVAHLATHTEIRLNNGIDLADCDPPLLNCPRSPYTSSLDDFAPTLRDPATLDLATTMTSQMMVDAERGQPSSTCCVGALFDSPDLGDPSATLRPTSVVAFGAAHLDGLSWYLTVNNKYFRDIRILPDAECQISSCPAPLKTPRSTTNVSKSFVPPSHVDSRKQSMASPRQRETPGTALAILDRPTRIPNANVPTSGQCCASNMYIGIHGIDVRFGDAALWADVANGPTMLTHSGT